MDQSSFHTPTKRSSERPVNEGSSKRPKESAHGGTVVEIDGVPPNISPKLMETIRATNAFFKHHPDDVISPTTRMTESSDHQQDVLESIIDRVEHVNQREAMKAERERRARMEQELDGWLNVLNHCKGERRSPAVGCLKYLWKLQQNRRPNVRRMSLYLCGHLLVNNQECRDRWLDGLLDWISSIVEVQHVPEKDVQENLLWQKEAHLWLSYMMNHFEGNNKLRVAALYLEQKGPSLYTEGFNANKVMAEWRQMRDVAMMHAERQCEIVDKLVRRGYEYIDTLVPRIGTEYDVDTSKDDVNEDVDDEDDHIDWEDGDEEAGAVFHAAAVEQTLALMQTTGGLRGGDMEIRLNEGNMTENGDNRYEHTKEQLQKVVTSLTTRHLPCLSTWVNAMAEADTLVLVNGSLVAMSREASEKRCLIAQRLMDLKRSVASVLSHASRLEVKAVAKRDVDYIPRNAFLTGLPQRHLSLSRTMERKRLQPSSDAYKKRSNRIQVKLNKTT